MRREKSPVDTRADRALHARVATIVQDDAPEQAAFQRAAVETC